ncbi:MAG TPA: ABC transporter permease [Steroidobacteraceae bacterium]|jgi:putative ABC transport system permease protein|nr:ABC transporter permease [Steroidobacteraceae bacterium]
MLGYYLRLSLKSLRRTPGLTALMVCAIALGIGACIVTLTVYHAMSGNPIWWKNNVLYAVTMDSWEAARPYDPEHPTLPPWQMTYKDATYLAQSNIPKRSVVMAQLHGSLSGVAGQRLPVNALTRATTGDFFAMFDVPFQYGGPWRAEADKGPEPVIVLSKAMNDTLFGGRDSVGKTVVWSGHQFRVTGVLADWQPLPKFYDLIDNGPFAAPEDVFVPFAWTAIMQQFPTGNTDCPSTTKERTFRDFLGSECVWTEMWVELPTAASRHRFQAFMDAYWAAQHRAGRFPRPLNNHLTTVDQWLQINGVVSSDSRILLRVAFAFLAVCLINTVGILLTKFLRGAPLTGLRRALGARRIQIFLQHIVEVSMVSLAGGTLGLALGAFGLLAVRALYGEADQYGALAHFDPLGVAWALALAALSTLAAGLYPALTAGRVPPAVYLKSR